MIENFNNNIKSSFNTSDKMADSSVKPSSPKRPPPMHPIMRIVQSDVEWAIKQHMSTIEPTTLMVVSDVENRELFDTLVEAVKKTIAEAKLKGFAITGEEIAVKYQHHLVALHTESENAGQWYYNELLMKRHKILHFFCNMIHEIHIRFVSGTFYTPIPILIEKLEMLPEDVLKKINNDLRGFLTMIHDRTLKDLDTMETSESKFKSAISGVVQTFTKHAEEKYDEKVSIKLMCSLLRQNIEDSPKTVHVNPKNVPIMLKVFDSVYNCEEL